MFRKKKLSDKSLNNVKELVELCDILHIYDNTDDLEKADQVQRIFRKHKAENYSSEERASFRGCSFYRKSISRK